MTQGSKFEARVEVRSFMTHVLFNYNGSLRATETTNKINPTSTDKSPKYCIEKDYAVWITAVFNLPIYPGSRMGSMVAP